MLELIGVLVTVVGVWIAYATLQHQKKVSARTATKGSRRAPQSPSGELNDEIVSDAGEHLKPGQIPDGIELGDKVLLVPGWQDLLFSHSGHFEESVDGVKSYCWINRGDIIGRYHMNVPNSSSDYFRHFLGSTDHSVSVRSPVSGLVLHSELFFLGDWPEQENVTGSKPTLAFSVLVAVDEPPPISGAKTYRDAINLVERYRWPFFSASRYWSKPAMTEDQFQALIDLQRNADCLYIDAMPKFKDYFEEARTKYPHLRPYIRHLL